MALSLWLEFPQLQHVVDELAADATRGMPGDRRDLPLHVAADY